MQKMATAPTHPSSSVEDLDQHRLRARLRDRERMLTTLMGNLRGIVYRCRIDEHWTIEFVSDGCRELTGYDPDDLVMNGRISYEELTHPDDRRRIRAEIDGALVEKRRFSIEYRIVCRNGEVKWVCETGVGVHDGADAWIEGFIQDISERKSAERAVREAERKYRSIFENATEGIFQSTPDGRYLEANPALARIYGYDTPAELVASLSNIGTQLYVEAARRDEFVRLAREHGAVHGFVSQVFRRNDEVIWVSENARPVYDSHGALQHYEGTVVDVSDSRRHEDQLRYQASHDALTLLPNRALLYDRLTQAIAHASRYGGLVGVAFVDLDHFKVVNDTLGHDAGDELLKAMAERMAGCVRGSDTVARPGGDEFVLVICGEPDEAALVYTLERIRKAVAEPWSSQGRSMRVTCSIGTAVFPRDGSDDAALLKSADVAMYRAKAAGRNTIEFFRR
jgi:diguanylate cyclase (GGDEF)-like protein/PAS domain S-box-containing protein